MKTAVFAGGCFWCLVPPFRDLPGVKKIEAGYAGGTQEHPSYTQVSTGKTGHVEAVRITYDDTITSYQDLLSIYWRQIDPFDERGQFSDQGSQYRTAIFYQNEEERAAAEQSAETIKEQFQQTPVVQLLPYKNFFLAEEEHQDYDKKHPLQYHTYKTLSGRKGYLERVWKE